jgi:hypothetical protein
MRPLFFTLLLLTALLGSGLTAKSAEDDGDFEPCSDNPTVMCARIRIPVG